MNATLEQRVRHAIVAHHARWFGRAPTTAELSIAVGAPVGAVKAALATLEMQGLVLQREEGWHTRPPRMTSRAGEEMAIRSKVQ